MEDGRNGKDQVRKGAWPAVSRREVVVTVERKTTDRNRKSLGKKERHPRHGHDGPPFDREPSLLSLELDGTISRRRPALTS